MKVALVAPMVLLCAAVGCCSSESSEAAKAKAEAEAAKAAQAKNETELTQLKAVTAKPPSFKELYEKVEAGKGKLTMQEVLKLHPVPFKVEGPLSADGDWNLTFFESDVVDVTLVDGKVGSAKARFSNSLDWSAGKLSFDTFKQIKTGMKKEEVEALLGMPVSEKTFEDKEKGQTLVKCQWSAIRHLHVTIKDGKVAGCTVSSWALPGQVID
jgi:hypothetical protein